VSTNPLQLLKSARTAVAVLVHRVVRQSPRQRFETALKVLSDPILRLKVRRIWETEMKGCSVFWDEAERQIELIENTHEIIIREHSTEEMWSGYSGIKSVLPNTQGHGLSPAAKDSTSNPASHG
jgi:hypothetical protein